MRQIYTLLIVELRCINILEEKDMNRYYRQIIVKARNRLNHGKQGRSKQGSAIRAFLLTWEKSVKFTLMVRIALIQL